MRSVLSEFGQDQVCQFARENAEEIDSRNSRWRYELESLLGYTAAISALLGVFSIVLIPLALLGWVDQSALAALGIAVGAIVQSHVFKFLAGRIANPEVSFLR